MSIEDEYYNFCIDKLKTNEMNLVCFELYRISLSFENIGIVYYHHNDRIQIYENGYNVESIYEDNIVLEEIIPLIYKRLSFYDDLKIDINKMINRHILYEEYEKAEILKNIKNKIW